MTSLSEQRQNKDKGNDLEHQKVISKKNISTPLDKYEHIFYNRH